jgi:shikimate dehydrogenase
MLTGKSVVCGIIGDPVEHSLSPVVHNAAFESAKLDYIYVPFRVRSENLTQAIEGMRALNIRGLSVTIPHKVKVIPLLDDIDTLAEHIGAVNTIVNQDGRLKGYNTDASGFLRSLTEQKIEISDKNIVVLGAGGAARAIAFTLADKGANLTIINRHVESAEKLAGRISSTFRKHVVSGDMSIESLKEHLNKADILVNTTSLGMYPDNDLSPVPSDLIKRDIVVVDIIYNPLNTKLLIDAKTKGSKTISGMEMLIFQAVAAFEIWTGKTAPVNIMREAAVQGVKKYEN